MRRIFVIAFIAAAALAAIATVAVIIIPLVMAQGEGEAVPAAPETTFGWVLAAWMIYAVAGLLASMTTSGEHWDTVKFARSLITAILTGFIALAFKISPANVETQFGGLVTTLANIIVNTAPGVTLIYLLDKIYKLIMNLKAKIEAARALSTPEPPK
jgi:hypothetical protein